MTDSTDYLQIDITKYQTVKEVSQSGGIVGSAGKRKLITRSRVPGGLTTQSLVNKGTVLLQIPSQIQDGNAASYGFVDKAIINSDGDVFGNTQINGTRDYEQRLIEDKVQAELLAQQEAEEQRLIKDKERAELLARQEAEELMLIEEKKQQELLEIKKAREERELEGF